MKKFKDLKSDFINITEARAGSWQWEGEGRGDSDLLRILKYYMTNDHYVHFTKLKTATMSKNPQYETTPAAIYAWQMNSYKKWIKMEVETWVKRMEANIKKDPKFYGSGGHEYTNVGGEFPYGQYRGHAVILKAKSGLKWFRVRRMSDKEIKKIYTTAWKGSKFIDIGEMVFALDKARNSGEVAELLEQIAADKLAKGKISVQDLEILNMWILLIDEITPYMWRNYKDHVSKSEKESMGVAAWMLFDHLFIRRKGIFAASELLSKMGYDAFRDDSSTEYAGQGGVIYPAEPAQVGFLHKKAFTVVAVLDTREMNQLFAEQLPKIKKALEKLK
ncbi:MAG: hypothetical protein ACO2ZZ_14680 [Cyclobacteriaceae bacterium]